MALAVAILACSRPRPSPEYGEARQLWTDVVRARGDGAAEDPRADEVLALLERVPHDSLDAPAAAELRGRIEGERKARLDELRRREELVAAAGAIPSMPATGSSSASAPTGAQAERAPPRALVPGMKLEEFREKYGRCFERRGPVQVTSPGGGAPRPGEMWAMKDSESCREEDPQLVGQLVLFSGGAFVGLGSKDELKTMEVRREVEVGTLPDGSLGEKVDGKVVPFPEGAKLERVDGGKP
jgi:hypothetical protein